jgi:catechol 2,3-dioxygenase-like lactoylglutathione lyase family enzyme
MKPQTVADLVVGYDAPVARLVDQYFRQNEAARTALEIANRAGLPLVIDHITIRTRRVDERAQEFRGLGFEYRDELIEYPDQGWWAKVYRKTGMPAVFIDQAYDDARGRRSLLPEWVQRFGDQVLHHIAVRVPDIEAAKADLERAGVPFSGEIVGPRGTRLRQIFTAAEVRDGQAFSVLELAERNGYEGFVPEQADGLMQSSVVKKTA